MSARQTLPPSERDFEIYRLLEVDGLSTREAAGLFELSQTRVMQIRDRVFQWLGKEAPPSASLTPAERLQAAQRTAGERLDNLYAVAMRCFRESQGDATTRRETQAGDMVSSTVVNDRGKVVYLQQALRIAVAALNVPLVGLKQEAALRKLMDDDAKRALALAKLLPADSEGLRGEADAASPPEVDCSAAAAPAASQAEVELSGESLLETPASTYDGDNELNADAWTSADACKTTVHAPDSRELLLRAVHAPLSRKERRARERRRTRALKRLAS